MELDIEDETDDVELPELPPLDLTLASDEEVLKVFKAMGDEDGIIIQQDDDEIELTDNTTDTEYIIKLDESKKTKTMKKAVNENKTEVSEMDMDNMDEMDDMDEMEEMDEEVVYEIELDEMDDMDEGHGKVMGVYQPESKRKLTDYEMEGGDMTEMEDMEEGGAKKGDQSATHRDYMKEGGAKKGDQSATHRDYMKEGGAKKGDQSATHRDYMKEGGAKKGDQSATHLDYEMKEGGAKKGDQSATHLDYEEVKEGGAKKGDQSATHKDYEEVKEASRTLGFGRKSNGKHKPSGIIEKLLLHNRNLGESRIRKVLQSS